MVNSTAERTSYNENPTGSAGVLFFALTGCEPQLEVIAGRFAPSRLSGIDQINRYRNAVRHHEKSVHTTLAASSPLNDSVEPHPIPGSRGSGACKHCMHQASSDPSDDRLNSLD